MSTIDKSLKPYPARSWRFGGYKSARPGINRTERHTVKAALGALRKEAA